MRVFWLVLLVLLTACVPEVAVEVDDEDNSTVIFQVGNKTFEVDTDADKEPEPLMVFPLIEIPTNITQNQEISINISAINEDNATFDSNLSYNIAIKDEDLIQEIMSSSNTKITPNETLLLEEIEIAFNNFGEHKIIVTFTENQSTSKQESFDVAVEPETIEEVKEIDQSKVDRAESEGGCYDSDGGQDFDEKGTCYDNQSFKYGREDFCSGDEVLGEVYCQNFKCAFVIEECENTCRDGECI